MREYFMWPIGTNVIVPDHNNGKGTIIKHLNNDLYEIELYNGPTIVTKSQSFQMIDYPHPPKEDGIEYLRMNELIQGGLYELDARNANLGIWIYEQLGFIIRRQKFNNIFLFVEYHYDTGSPFGTVRPFIFIEKCPFSMETLQIQLGDIDYKYQDIMLEYLKRKEDQYGRHPKK